LEFGKEPQASGFLFVCFSIPSGNPKPLAEAARSHDSLHRL
jgi:hypothetical protein